jgi:hypothetical protein
LLCATGTDTRTEGKHTDSIFLLFLLITPLPMPCNLSLHFISRTSYTFECRRRHRPLTPGWFSKIVHFLSLVFYPKKKHHKNEMIEKWKSFMLSFSVLAVIDF